MCPLRMQPSMACSFTMGTPTFEQLCCSTARGSGSALGARRLRLGEPRPGCAGGCACMPYAPADLVNRHLLTCSAQAPEEACMAPGALQCMPGSAPLTAAHTEATSWATGHPSGSMQPHTVPCAWSRQPSWTRIRTTSSASTRTGSSLSRPLSPSPPKPWTSLSSTQVCPCRSHAAHESVRHNACIAMNLVECMPAHNRACQLHRQV